MHGHTWTVRAHWRFRQLDGQGMGMNFRTLRRALGELIHDRFDHRHLNDIAPFDSVAPTAENLAREIYRILGAELEVGDHGELARVEVWEGPESCVSYEEQAPRRR
jgi:6-pyruvoyltetrahydropterin/6-carboxytetrahydropterin synthase